MDQERRYFNFSVVQYVHDRREERLNVGVVVHDPTRRELRAQFEPAATKRVKAAFPEVDRKGLELYLTDLAATLAVDPAVAAAVAEGRPFEHLATWTNVIRFTPARAYPAVEARQACAALLRRYVAPPPAMPARELRGIELAKSRTREALLTVLDMTEGVGFRRYEYAHMVYRHGKEHRVPREFPFLVMDRFAIDALSFEGEGVKASSREASLFIEKANDLRKAESEIVPCASVAIDPERPDIGRALMADILDKTGLPDDTVVEAEDSATLARYIRAHLPQAA